MVVRARPRSLRSRARAASEAGTGEPRHGSARAVLALYAASGLFSLGYQVVWLRHFVDRFGSSTFTFVLVICGFIGGLGLCAIRERLTQLGGEMDIASRPGQGTCVTLTAPLETASTGGATG